MEPRHLSSLGNATRDSEGRLSSLGNGTRDVDGRLRSFGNDARDVEELPADATSPMRSLGNDTRDVEGRDAAEGRLSGLGHNALDESRLRSLSEDTSGAEAQLLTDAYAPSAGHMGFGVLAHILNTKGMPPFYLMPLLTGMQVAVAFAITGFELRFKRSASEETLGAVGQRAQATAELVGGVLLLVGTLNGWYRDLAMFAELPEGSYLELLLAFLAILVCSPNYAQAIAVCTPRILQSPAHFLNATPKFKHGPYGFPVVPGKGWLPCASHVASLALLPYFGFRYTCGSLFYGGFVSKACLAFLAVATCCLVLSNYQVFLGLIVLAIEVIVWFVVLELMNFIMLLASVLGVIVTLGMWDSAKSSVIFYWNVNWPLRAFWLFNAGPLS